MPPSEPPPLPPQDEDEEARVRAFPDLDRKARGAYFTPAPLVERVLAHALACAPPGPGLLCVVDPACGAGAFLAGAARRVPDAALFGLELEPGVAAAARARLPGAHVQAGDALRGGLVPLLAELPAGAREVWVGNPPYNGTSSLLRDATAYAPLRALLPERLPPGTSLRDDFALFLLVAAARVAERSGVLAFITPASLLDGYLYAPLRRWLLERLALVDVVDLGRHAFHGAQVHTCFSVWRTGTAAHAPRFHAEDGTVEPLAPDAPEWRLRPTPPEAAALDARWRAAGEPLTTLVPVSLPGVKTRFDELLVDTDPARLLARVAAFAATPPEDGPLRAFARAHAIPEELLPKLRALRAAGPLDGVHPERVRPFVRWAGARHRGRVPEDAWAWCYLDRRLIPRGDHRLRGSYDPHRGAVKLLFNVRERPLFAALLEREACVHDHRHARFAPLLVPRRLRDEGLLLTRSRSDLGELVPNLSPRGLAWAEARHGGPLGAFRWLVEFLNGPEVQGVWAPAFAASRVVPVPLDG